MSSAARRSLSCACGGGCPRCRQGGAGPRIQAKLTAGSSGDLHEQQADRAAAQVLSGPTGAVDVHPAGARAIQATPSAVHADVESRLGASRGGGIALPSSVRAFMEPRFGADFADVRVHTGGDAARMNADLHAQAFAYGSDIYYARGRSAGNDALTAHELTHVVQQTGTNVSPIVQRQPEEPSAADASMPGETERQAVIRKGAAAIERQGGTARWRYLAANPEGSLWFIMFNDFDVQKLHRHLLEEWLGQPGPTQALEDTAMDTPPAWVGEFRAHALNLRGRKPQDVDAEYAEQRELGELAVTLADSVAGETPAQMVRRRFVQEVDKRVGTTVMTQEAIDAERAKPAENGLTPSNFTTCIAFLSQVTQAVTQQAGISGALLNGPNYYKEIDKVNGKENLPPGAWHPCTPTTRPKPGDLLIFTFSKNETSKTGTFLGKGYFAHISILRSIEPVTAADKNAGGATERWVSVDGGGTQAQEVIRYFTPDTCQIQGPGTIIRTVHGWIDIEKVAEAKLAGPVSA